MNRSTTKSGVTRRSFLGAAGFVAATRFDAAPSRPPAAPVAARGTVRMTGDGLEMTPAEAAAELARLTSARTVVADEYGLGGEVEAFEAWFAALLGKERALFMPTGTLANHLALRALAEGRPRVLVQEVSHVYNDTGDAAQVLSGLNVVPLAPGQATFTRADVERVLERTASGRVRSGVGAISIESPVRRLAGATFDLAEMRRISDLGRKEGIGLHLDGARLFIASAYTGVGPAEYAALFDTVYVSLWKCFNSLEGAVLAGPARVLDGMFHVRRMFGGALWAAWPFALLARRYGEGLVERLRAAVALSDEFLGRIDGEVFTVERIPNGTNVVRLRLRRGDAEALRRRLGEDGIVLPPVTATPEGPLFVLRVNETWNRTTAAALAEAFRRAAG